MYQSVKWGNARKFGPLIDVGFHSQMYAASSEMEMMDEGEFGGGKLKNPPCGRPLFISQHCLSDPWQQTHSVATSRKSPGELRLGDRISLSFAIFRKRELICYP